MVIRIATCFIILILQISCEIPDPPKVPVIVELPKRTGDGRGFIREDPLSSRLVFDANIENDSDDFIIKKIRFELEVITDPSCIKYDTTESGVQSIFSWAEGGDRSECLKIEVIRNVETHIPPRNSSDIITDKFHLDGYNPSSRYFWNMRTYGYNEMDYNKYNDALIAWKMKYDK